MKEQRNELEEEMKRRKKTFERTKKNLPGRDVRMKHKLYILKIQKRLI